MYLAVSIFGVLLLLCSKNAVNGQDVRFFPTSCGNSSTLKDAYRYGAFCNSIFGAWFGDTVDPDYLFYDFRYRGYLFFINSTRQWASMCQRGHGLASCLDSLLPQCQPGVGMELLRNPAFIPENYRQRFEEVPFRRDYLFAFYRRTCQEMTVKAELQQSLDDPDFDKNMTCLNMTHNTEIQQCVNGLESELNFEQNRYRTSAAYRRTINRIAGASVNCMFSVINRSPCNMATKTVLYQVARLQLPSFIDETELSLDQTTTGDFSALLRCTVGVYGDPHIKLCGEPSLITCSAEGARVLLANGWFFISGRNGLIPGSFSFPLTTLRAIQIVFQSLDTNDVIGIYAAENGNLPATFDNTNKTVIGEGDDQVTLTIEYNKLVFVQASTGMILALRQWSGNYFFTLRVSQDVIKRSHGLLASGCPTSETLNRSTFRRGLPALRRKRAVTEAQCEMACNDTITDRDFAEICAFDCYATDDIEFGVNMTSEAVQDTIEVVRRDEELRAGAVTLPPTPPVTTATVPTTTSSSQAVHFSISLLILSLVYAIKQ